MPVHPLELVESLKPTLRPLLYARLRHLFSNFWPVTSHHEQFYYDCDCILHYHDEDLGAADELRGIGLILLQEGHLRRRKQGCVWLTHFPGAETIEALARLVDNPSEPAELRNQAVWTLGFRQARRNHPRKLWKPCDVEAADAVLARAWERGDHAELDNLAPAARSGRSEVLHQALAANPSVGARAVDAFCSESLARVFLRELRSVGSEDTRRVIRLIGHRLGRECVDGLLAFAEDAPYATRWEAWFTVLALEPDRILARVESELAGMAFPQQTRERVDWHLAHPGVFPTVEALAVARTTAEIPAEERAPRAAKAARLLADVAGQDYFAEAYLYTFWRELGWMAHQAEPAQVELAAQSTPDALSEGEFLVVPYIEALARQGKFRKICEIAPQHGYADRAAWELASYGRPFLALRMRGACGLPTEFSTAAQVLALFLGGRPDLAMRTLEVDLPAPAVHIDMEPQETRYPGPDERFRAGNEPMIAALTGGLPSLLALACPAAPGADPDEPDFTLLARLEKRLAPGRAGASVWVAPDVPDRQRVIALLASQGARLVSGPFPGTEVCVVSSSADPATLSKLASQGAELIDWRAVV